jgi:hypothetical protein
MRMCLRHRVLGVTDIGERSSNSTRGCILDMDLGSTRMACQQLCLGLTGMLFPGIGPCQLLGQQRAMP